MLRDGHELGRPFLDIRGLVGSRRRARTALDRLPARLRAEPSLLRLLHGQRRQHPRRRIPARAVRPGPTRGSRRTRDRDPPPGQRQPQRRPAAVPRRPALLRHRRRRLRRRSAQQRPEQGEPARQAAAHRPAPQRRPALLGPGRQSLRRQARPRRDLLLRPAQPLPLLLRHDQRRAAPDRDRRRRPEPLRGARLHDPRRRQRRQLRLGRLRGLPRYKEENSGTPDPGGTTKPIMAYSHSRDGGSCTIIGGYVVGAGGPPPARPLRLHRLLLRRSCAASFPTCTAPAAIAARPHRHLPHLVRRRRAGPHLRLLAGRIGFQARYRAC